MLYNLKSILEIQKQLNQKIWSTQNITFDETKIQSHLCILIELMELCNETRCFNYWSKKKRSSDEVVLEEFADVLCFLLSDLIFLNIEDININESIKQEDNLSITKRFSKLVKLYNDLDFSIKNTYINFAVELFELGYALGFDIDKITTAYKKKVLKNHQVQDEFNK